MKKMFNKLKVYIFMVLSFLFLPKDVQAANIICNDSIKSLIEKYWGYIELAGPIILIVVSMIEFLKAIMSNDNDALSKSVSRTVKRMIAVIVLFVLPLIIRTIFRLADIESSICY